MCQHFLSFLKGLLVKKKLDYLCVNESFSKTILACLSGAQGGSIYEKKDKKSRDTATLSKPQFLLLSTSLSPFPPKKVWYVSESQMLRYRI